MPEFKADVFLCYRESAIHYKERTCNIELMLINVLKRIVHFTELFIRATVGVERVRCI